MPGPLEPHTTVYRDTFIAVAPDCPVSVAVEPPQRGAAPSVALRTFRMLADEPYRWTSDDVVFGVHADRQDIPAAERDAARQEYFSVGRPCLRASDLGKRYGWGTHHDGEGRIALVGMGTPDYAELEAGRCPDGTPVTVLRAMRSRR